MIQWLILIFLSSSLKVNAATPDSSFELFLRSNTPTAQLYKVALQAGLINGLQSTSPPNCRAVIEAQSEIAEISLLKMLCAIQLDDQTLAEKMHSKLLSAPKVWFYEDNFEKEYLTLSLGRPTRPSDILTVFHISSSRPIIDYSLMNTKLQKATGRPNVNMANIGLKLEIGAKEAMKSGEAGVLANAVGLKMQIDVYTKCKELPDCKKI
jgi:hypothetical protein